MAGVNKAILIGHLGHDPDVRTMQSGDRVVSFSLATSESWRDKATGERRERTDWHNVVIFNDAIGKVAEQYLRKGSKVYVEGAMKTRDYTDRDGVARKAFEIVLARFRGEMTLLDARKDDGRYDAGMDGKSASAAQPIAQQIDDDIPF